MEANNIAVLEHDNKENIPPFSTSKKPGSDEEMGKCALMKMKGSRRPLRDVRNFYRAAEFRGFNSKLPSSVLVSVCLRSRKRKLVDDDAEQRTCSKILRREYR